MQNNQFLRINNIPEGVKFELIQEPQIKNGLCVSGKNTKGVYFILSDEKIKRFKLDLKFIIEDVIDMLEYSIGNYRF